MPRHHKKQEIRVDPAGGKVSKTRKKQLEKAEEERKELAKVHKAIDDALDKAYDDSLRLQMEDQPPPPQ